MATRSDDALGFYPAVDVAYMTVNWWIWDGITWPELASQSKAQAIYDYGFCSKNHRGIVKSWKDVGLLANENLLCVIIPLRGWNAVQISQAEEIRFKPEFDSPEVPKGGTFEYEIPDTWEAYQEGNDLIVTGFTSYESRRLKVKYTTSNGEVFENEKVMHIVDDEENVNYSNVNFGVMSYEITEKEQSSNKAIVYPNPAGSSVKIMLPAEVRNAQLSLTDIQGRLIYNGQIPGLHIDFSLPNLPSGSYILRVNAQNLNTVNRIQIVQNKP